MPASTWPSRRKTVTNYRPVIPVSWSVLDIGNKTLQVAGIGDAHVFTMIYGSQGSGTLQSVLHVPKLGTNLFSIRKAAERCFKDQFENNTFHILSKVGQISTTGRLTPNKMYRLDFHIVMPALPSPSPIQEQALVSQTLKTCHRRLGHLCRDTITRIQQSDIVNDLIIKKDEKASFFCGGCVMGKHHRLPFPKNCRHRACRAGQIIHFAVVGPNQTTLQGGSNFFVTFINNCSRYTTVKLMKEKSEVFTNYENYSARTKKETGLEINTSVPTTMVSS